MDLDFLSKKWWKNKPLHEPKHLFAEWVAAVQHDMWGEHSDDESGKYAPRETWLPVDDAAREIVVCNYPDINTTDQAIVDKHKKTLKNGQEVAINTEWIMIDLLGDGVDLRGEHKDLVRGLGTRIILLNNGTIKIDGQFTNKHGKEVSLELFFTLTGWQINK